MRTGCLPGPRRPGDCRCRGLQSGSAALTQRGRVKPHECDLSWPWYRGPYFFLQKPFTCFQKWRSNVNFHGLFIALPYREKEKKWLKCDFTKYFVCKKLSLCGQKGKRKVTVFIVLSRLSHKEGSVLQIKIVQPLPADKKYEFWGQLQTNPSEQKYIVGGGDYI